MFHFTRSYDSIFFKILKLPVSVKLQVFFSLIIIIIIVIVVMWMANLFLNVKYAQ